MIIGIGSDIVEIARIQRLCERYDSKFLLRLFTEQELKIANQRKLRYAFYAKRFAGKEAVLKALGTGLTQGVSWQDIEIINDSNGRPLVFLKDCALRLLLNKLGQAKDYNIHITLTDETLLAQAFVVIEAL